MLKPGERIPTDAPARRTDGNGYIRLIWRVDVDSYVEVYEHRVEDDPYAGKFVTYSHWTKHRNGDRSDNRPENLERRYTKRRS